MKYSIIILITQLLLWGCCRSERSILESFYKALDGDKWEHKENWLSDKPLNEWYGITTDEKGKVVKIQLSDTMTGKVPANLKHLKRLQSLHLNCMAGGIRLEVNNYPSLKELGLHGYINQLTVENCSELEKLSATPKYFDNFHIDHCPQLSFLELEGPPFETIKKTLDLPSFPKLSELKIYHLALDQLHINNCFNLKKINIYNCQLEELDLSSQVNLEYLEVSGNDSLHTLDLNNCVKLDSIDVSRNSITQLNISNCKKLRYLDCSYNKLSELELNNPLLCTLYCDNNEISKLDVTNFKELKHLYCEGNNLSELDVSKCKELEQLSCGFNNLSELNVRQNSKLYFIECGGNNLQSIDLSKNQELEDFRCEDSPIKELDISHCPKLEHINIYGSQITTIDISHLDKLYYFKAYRSSLKTIWISKNFEPMDMWFIEDDVVCKIKQ
jgi:leucine rich repeat protein